MTKQSSSTKTTHVLKSPYPTPSWPTIPTQTENSILDALLPLLSPIGQYRQRHVAKSRGKKRKRRLGQSDTNQDNDVPDTPTLSELSIPHYLTVGFNSTVRYLESLAKCDQSPGISIQDEAYVDPGNIIIFVGITSLPAVMTNPLALLVAFASRSCLNRLDIRLVPVTQQGTAAIAKSLNQPRVSVLGVLANAPEVNELHELVKTHVESVRVPWNEDSLNAIYRPVKTQSEEIELNSRKDIERRQKKANRTS